MTPTLRQFEYIVALAETGQFVEAARTCGVSQPALSKQIKDVEYLLGFPVFERTRPLVIVTPAGQEIVRRAREILAKTEELMNAARAAAGLRQGTVRLGVIPTIAPYGLPGFLMKLRRVFPEVSFAIQEIQTETLLTNLKSGAVDLALLAQPFDASGLSGKDVVIEPFVLLAPTGHPLSSPFSVNAEDLAGASLILMEDGHCLRDQAIDVCARAGRPPATSVTAASISTLVRMVESGLGATLLPASALAAEVRQGEGVQARSFGKRPPGRTITLQWRQTAPNASWYEEIAQILREHYLELNAGLPKIAGPKPRIVAA